MVQYGRTVSTRRSLDQEVGLGLSVEKNREPVSPRRMRRIVRIAGAYRKLANPRIAQHPQRGLREYLRTALRVGDNFSIVVRGGEQVCVRNILCAQRPGALIKIPRFEPDQSPQTPLLPYLIDGPAHYFPALLR